MAPGTGVHFKVMYGAGLILVLVFAGERLVAQVGTWAFKVVKQTNKMKSVNVFFMKRNFD